MFCIIPLFLFVFRLLCIFLLLAFLLICNCDFLHLYLFFPFLQHLSCCRSVFLQINDLDLYNRGYRNDDTLPLFFLEIPPMRAFLIFCDANKTPCEHILFCYEKTIDSVHFYYFCPLYNSNIQFFHP